MSPPSAVQPRRVVVIGSHGVLGSLLVKAFASEAWHVLQAAAGPTTTPTSATSILISPRPWPQQSVILTWSSP